MQTKIDFGNDLNEPSLISPKGYRGLSGFHKYWGKKPTEAWHFLIENLTKENDIVLDPFLGSGLVAKECVDRKRRFVGIDINPICIELTNLFLDLPNYRELQYSFLQLEKKLKPIINEMYQLSNEQIASHILWDNKQIVKIWRKKGGKRIEEKVTENEIQKLQQIESYTPKNIRELRLFDNSRINSKKDFDINDFFTPRALKAIDLLKVEIESYNGNIKRALLLVLSASLGQMSNMVFAVTKRGKNKGVVVEKVEVGSWVIGYWRPEKHFEINSWNCFENKMRRLLKAIKETQFRQKCVVTPYLHDFFEEARGACLSVGDSQSLLKKIPSQSISVILTDPPHGDRIPYLELSEMWNSVLNLHSEYEDELVISNAKTRKKDASTYNKKILDVFDQCSRILKKGGVLAVMFNARSEEHWSSVKELEQATVLEYIGCYPMEYSAGSVVQDNRSGSLKTDFVLLYAKDITTTGKQHFEKLFQSLDEWSSNYPQNGK